MDHHFDGSGDVHYVVVTPPKKKKEKKESRDLIVVDPSK